MVRKTRNNIFQVAPIIISIIALIATVKSCSDSDEALKFSKETFEEIRKPELILKTARREGVPYIQYKAYDDSFKVVVQVRVENIGRRPATVINFPVSTMRMEILDKEHISESSSHLGSPLSLSFNQDYYHAIHLNVRLRDGLEAKPGQFEKIVKQLKEQNTPATIDVAVEYTDASTSKKYSLTASYRITQSNSYILHYNYPVLISK